MGWGFAIKLRNSDLVLRLMRDHRWFEAGGGEGVKFRKITLA